MPSPKITTHDQFMKNILNENMELKKENKEIKQDTIDLNCLIDELSDSVDNVIKYGQQCETYGIKMGKIAKLSISLNLILIIIIALNFIEYS